jgi:hypothetical protein
LAGWHTPNATQILTSIKGFSSCAPAANLQAVQITWQLSAEEVSLLHIMKTASFAPLRLLAVAGDCKTCAGLDHIVYGFHSADPRQESVLGNLQVVVHCIMHHAGHVALVLVPALLISRGLTRQLHAFSMIDVLK